MRKFLVFLLILLFPLIHLVNAGYDLQSALPTIQDFTSLKFNSVVIQKDTNTMGLYYQRIIRAQYSNLDNSGVTAVTWVGKVTSTASIDERMKTEKGNCVKQENSYYCKIKENYDGKKYKYSAVYYYFGLINAGSCTPLECNAKSTSDPMIAVEIKVMSAYNITDPGEIIGPALVNDVLSRLGGKTSFRVHITKPRDKETIYYIPGKELSIPVEVKVENGNPSYVAAHYESNGVMVGGQINNFANGKGSIFIQLQPDEIFPQAKIKAYADDSDETSITIYLKPNNAQDNKQTNSQQQNNQQQNNHQKNNPPVAGKTDKDSKKNTGSKNSITNSNNKPKLYINGKPSNDIKKINKLSKLYNDAVRELKSTSQIPLKINDKSSETITLKTPAGNLIKAVKKDNEINARKGTSLWFKLKYGMNKYLVDPIIDTISSKLPGIGLYKDYFKSDKDTNAFYGEEDEKTAKDLGVSRKTANIYNQLSGIEDTEKKISPLKNSINLPSVAKPMQFAMDALTMGTKKIIARYYRKEYNYIVKLAKSYRERGMKWADVHNIVKRDLEENEGGITGLSSAEENAASQYLNTISKGQYKDIKARADLYIQQAMENGELK